MRLLPSGISLDIVIRVRPEAYDAAYSALAADVDRVLEQLLRQHRVELEALVEPSVGHRPDHVREDS
jgi:RNase P protein component